MLNFFAKDAKLEIVQASAPEVSANEKYTWNLRLELVIGSRSVFRNDNVSLEEPFTPDDYDYVAKYLDKALDDDLFNQAKGDAISKLIDDYRETLFARLQASDLIPAIHGKRLHIHIYPDINSSDRRSLNSIQWEQLEHLALWRKERHGGPQSVSVCRHMISKETVKLRWNTEKRARKGRRSARKPAKNSARTGAQSENSGLQDNDTINILLVVARDDIHRDLHHYPRSREQPYSILNPATVRGVLLHLQEQLRSSISWRRIRLEIVRPGSLEELEAHLHKRGNPSHGRRRYHVVHLDLHGSEYRSKC